MFIAVNFQRSHFPYTWPSSFEPPFPYEEPTQWYYPRFKVMLVRNCYYNALHYTDKQIGKIINTLKQQGIYKKSLIIITGDHGEAFHEHNNTVHANQLFNETATTALIIKNSNQLNALSINKIPELIDIPPTILKLLNFPPHPSFQGTSIDETAPQRPIFMMINSPIAEQDAVIYQSWKLMYDFRLGDIKLYNLKDDPFEYRNIFSQHPNQAQNLLYLLFTWRNEQLKFYSQSHMQKKFYPPQFTIK